MIYVYILRSEIRAEQLYVGVTSNVYNRIQVHNQGSVPHTSKFRPWKLVYFEITTSIQNALKRERQIKKWTRLKKEALIANDVQRLKKLAKRRCFSLV